MRSTGLQKSGEKGVMKTIPRIFCILCECKSAGNMGAVARAIKNMGLDGLILVRPNRERWLEAIKMAPGAEEILEKAKICNCLEDAISDMHYVIGTTKRIRKYRPEVSTPFEVMTQIIGLPADHKMAILFGSERTGLTNHELSFCQRVVVIPTSKALSSINLAQAVMIMAYEWHMACERTQDKKRDLKRELAGADQRQRLIDHTEEVLKRIGFLKDQSGHIRLTLIDMLSRLDLTEREVALLRGILRQIEYCLGKKRPEDG